MTDAKLKGYLLPGLEALRIEQAKLLKSEVAGSCITVLCLITYFSVILLLSGQTQNAAIWFALTTTMVVVVYLYARFQASGGISAENVSAYLQGHVFISVCTGLVWGGFAIFILDGSSYLSLFVAGSIVCSITAGGMLPSSAYRPSYAGLATACLVPLALYWLLTIPEPSRYISLGLLLYYGFGMLISAKAEINTHDVIAAREANRLMAELSQKNELLQSAYDEKARFLAATSHDLSQPLHAQGYFIEALRRALTDSSQHELLDKVETSWRNQGILLQGIIGITRLDSGVIKPKPQVIDLPTELKYLACEYDEATVKKTITLNCQFAPASIKTDPLLLTRILRNLITNAVKFTPTGGRIDFISTLKNDQLEITIRDNGQGIAAADHERIFSEYIQLDNGGAEGETGLGLGLSIVQRLVKLLDIELRFQSAVGEGTEFTLILPNTIDGESNSVDDNNEDEERNKLSTAALIVIVDNEKDIRDGMSMLLTDWGCQVITAASGVEAIVLLNTTPEVPSLLLVDQRLAKNENGFDVIERLREEVNAEIPAVIMTGDLAGFKNLDHDSDIQIMPKPINPSEIKRLIECLPKVK